MNSGNELFLIRKLRSSIVKIFNNGNNYSTYNFGTAIELFHVEVSKTSDVIYVGGRNQSSHNPFLAKSTNGGANYTIILDGSSDPNSLGYIYHMNIVNVGSNDIVKISCSNKIIEYNSGNNNIAIITDNLPSEERKICFSDNNNGFYIKKDFADDNPLNPLYNSAIFMTKNNGQNWVQVFSNQNTSISYTNRFYAIGNMLYFTNSIYDERKIEFYSRNLIYSLKSYYNNVLDNGVMKINNINYSTSGNITYTLKGGVFPIFSEPIIQEGQINEKVFYKWSDNKMKNSINNYSFFYDGNLSNFYKTKSKADNQWAIYYPNQVKALKDLNNTINQIHMSIGGIFYSRSTNSGVSYSREEIVNGGAKYNNNFPDDVTASSNNKNPSICEIININNGQSVSNLHPDKNIAATWESYNDGMKEIKVAIRNEYYSQLDWLKYEYSSTPNNKGVIRSFPASSNFDSKPVIFASTVDEQGIPLSDTYEYLFLVPHLEPSTNGGNKIVVSAKCKNHLLYSNVPPVNNFVNDFTITENNEAVVDYSVIAIPIVNSSTYVFNGYELHFAYKVGNTIFYRKAAITFGFINSETVIGLNSNEVQTISNGDGQLWRYSPDISIRNGYPIIAYQGYNRNYYVINMEGDEPQTQERYMYPVVVRYQYKTTNFTVNWSDFIKYNSDGVNEQKKPNVEGSRNSSSFLLNFLVGNNYYKKFVHIFNNPGYQCSPNTFTGTDAALVKGSNYGDLKGNHILFTLNQNGSLYDISKQEFTVTNAPSSESPNTNLAGVVRDLGVNYYFNLGPIIAKNVTYDAMSDLETVVENPAEFNENMISKPFSLSNGDTLIIGGKGFYTYFSGMNFVQKDYKVELIKKSDESVFRNLFDDMIKEEDSIETEYLRGFIITGISGGTDSFYVKMTVDPEDITDGDFLYSNVYSPDEDPGDNPLSKNKFVFFEKTNGTPDNTPKEFTLSQNYPNPFNPVTNIQFQVQSLKLVKLIVYDMLGREVKVLVNEIKSPGKYIVSFDASSLSSGVYFYKMTAGEFTNVKRMVLVK